MIGWKRILIKMSGEALAGPLRFGFDTETVAFIVRQICSVREMGLQVGVTIGGGNIFRGSLAPEGIERITGDTMGMLATTMNGLALRDLIRASGVRAEVYSSLDMPTVARRYVQQDALDSLKEGSITIFSGGTGRPYFTTDTAAALTALEMRCDLLIKATNVDGVYSGNPSQDPSATLFRRISYQEVLERNLRVMDLTAMALLKDHNLPLMVLNIHQPDNLAKMAKGEQVGTYVSND